MAAIGKLISRGPSMLSSAQTKVLQDLTEDVSSGLSHSDDNAN